MKAKVTAAQRRTAAQRLADCRAKKHVFSGEAPYGCLYCLCRGDALSALDGARK